MPAIILAIGVVVIIKMSLPPDAWMELMPTSRLSLFNSSLLTRLHHKIKKWLPIRCLDAVDGNATPPAQTGPPHNTVSSVLFWHALHCIYH